MGLLFNLKYSLSKIPNMIKTRNSITNYKFFDFLRLTPLSFDILTLPCIFPFRKFKIHWIKKYRSRLLQLSTFLCLGRPWCKMFYISYLLLDLSKRDRLCGSLPTRKIRRMFYFYAWANCYGWYYRFAISGWQSEGW